MSMIPKEIEQQIKSKETIQNGIEKRRRQIQKMWNRQNNPFWWLEEAADAVEVNCYSADLRWLRQASREMGVIV